MSQNHLTERAWKTLALTHQIKDLGLGKALAVYGQLDAAKDPADAASALQQVASLALKVKKANAGNRDVVTHLEELAKEVKKTLPAIEARTRTVAGAAQETGRARAAEHDSDDEEDAAALRKDLKGQLTSAMARVRKRAPGDPEQLQSPKPQLQFMACVEGNRQAVIVARRVGSATKKLLLEIAGAGGGSKFFRGECLFENDSHTFVLPQASSGMARRIAAALFAETGHKYRVSVRDDSAAVAFDADAEADVAGDGDGDEVAAATTTDDLAARWQQVKRSLFPRIKEVLAGSSPDRDEVRGLVTNATRQEQSGDYEAAIATFEELRRRLDGSSPTQDVRDDDEATWIARREAIEAPYLAAVRERPGRADKLRAVLAFADGKAEAREFDKALVALDRLEQALAAQPADDGPAAVDLQPWQAACAEIRRQLEAVETEIVSAGVGYSIEAV
ncbi:MAG: hypothetical protein KDE27_03070, partial [Planctomycetes bacterium]|nr:hypothetical protein [Planctomycetota bacterium]